MEERQNTTFILLQDNLSFQRIVLRPRVISKCWRPIDSFSQTFNPKTISLSLYMCVYLTIMYAKTLELPNVPALFIAGTVTATDGKWRIFGEGGFPGFDHPQKKKRFKIWF